MQSLTKWMYSGIKMRRVWRMVACCKHTMSVDELLSSSLLQRASDLKNGDSSTKHHGYGRRRRPLKENETYISRLPPFMQDALRRLETKQWKGWNAETLITSDETDAIADDLHQSWEIAANCINEEVFHHDSWRPFQKTAVGAIVQGRDAFVLLPTGGGKSLTFQIPALLRPGITIVISPLISLMEDQVAFLRSLGIPAALLRSQMDHYHDIVQQVYQSRLKLLYVTPERLMYSRDFNALLEALHRQQRLGSFVVDEAQCVYEWGHGFRPTYRTLGQLRQVYPGVPLMALTAAVRPSVARDIRNDLRMSAGALMVRSSFNRPSLRYRVVPKTDTVLEDLASLALKDHPKESGIVYCTTCADCERVAKELRELGVVAEAYHAKRSMVERMDVQHRWMNETTPVVCTTVAFGMGIDKPNVRFVAHHSPPYSLSAYYQQSGRAGRDGLPADCVLYFRKNDVFRIRHVLRSGQGEDEVLAASRIENDDEEAAMAMMSRVDYEYCLPTLSEDLCERLELELDEVMIYGTNHCECRRSALVEHFGEPFSSKECNGTCDVCLRKKRGHDVNPLDVWFR